MVSRRPAVRTATANISRTNSADHQSEPTTQVITSATAASCAAARSPARSTAWPCPSRPHPATATAAASSTATTTPSRGVTGSSWFPAAAASAMPQIQLVNHIRSCQDVMGITSAV